MSRDNGGQHATLNDVAREANVSVSTAARVLRGSTYPVAPDLQDRVRKAAEKLRYVPNLLAKKLRGGAHPSLGLIVGNMVDPYFGQIAQAVTVAAQARSLLAIVANMQRDPQLELAMIRELWEHRVNGLVLAGGGFDQMTYKDDLVNLLRQLEQSGIVVVSLAERGISTPVFSVDNEAVGAFLVTHAIAQGHCEIGIAAGPANSFVTQQRMKGIRGALAKAGIKAPIVNTEFGIAGGVDATDRLLDANPKLTAILASADTLAVGILQRLGAIGRGVPEDISVIGAGNTSYCRICSPTLTTIDIGLAECCEAAVQYVADALAGETPAQPKYLLSRLVTGQSFQPLEGSEQSGAGLRTKQKTRAC